MLAFVDNMTNGAIVSYAVKMYIGGFQNKGFSSLSSKVCTYTDTLTFSVKICTQPY